MNQPTATAEVKPDLKPEPTDYQRRFKQGRLAAGGTLKGLAAEVGISFQAIGQFELGKQGMKLDHFLKACEALHLSTSWVLHGTGTMFLTQRPAPTRRTGRPADRRTT